MTFQTGSVNWEKAKIEFKMDFKMNIDIEKFNETDGNSFLLKIPISNLIPSPIKYNCFQKFNQ